MGNKTFQSLNNKPLSNRHNIILSSNPNTNQSIHSAPSIPHALSIASQLNSQNLFIIGGASIYNQFLSTHWINIEGIIITRTPEFECDTFIDINLNDFIEKGKYKMAIYPHQIDEGYTLNIYSKSSIPDNWVSSLSLKPLFNHVDIDYLKLVKKIIKSNNKRETRNSTTLSIFSHKLSINLQNGFPLLTTKKVFFDGVIRELLWFIKGQTNSKILEKNKVNIWKGNSSQEFLENNFLPYKEGICGPIYGFQWRKFGEKYPYITNNKLHYTDGIEQGFEQLGYILHEIKKNPTSRRLFMSGWNPNQIHQMCLPPCHVSYQFYVDNGKLSCQMYQRSADVFLGLPFNIASTALLVHLMAKMLDFGVGMVHICIGDAHIYEDHLGVVEEQLRREGSLYELPEVEVLRKVDKIEHYEFEDIVLKNYKSHPMIKAKMFA